MYSNSVLQANSHNVPKKGFSNPERYQEYTFSPYCKKCLSNEIADLITSRFMRAKVVTSVYK